MLKEKNDRLECLKNKASVGLNFTDAAISGDAAGCISATPSLTKYLEIVFD